MSERRDDDDAEGQCSDRIHRHVALEEPGGQGSGRVFARGGVVRRRQRGQAEEHQQDEESQKDRGEDLAEAVDDCARIPTQVEGDAEEDEAEDDRCDEGLRADDGRDSRRERHGTGAWQRVEGADRQVHEHGEDEAEGLTGAVHEVAHIGARQSDRDDRDDRQSDAADEETDHCGSEVRACGGPHDRWEDQVACPEEHREKGQGGRDEDGGAARASSGIIIDCLRHCYSLDGVGSLTAPILA